MNCDYCGKAAEKVTGKEVYPHRPDLHHKKFFRCLPCDALVGCHPDGSPLGRLANPELRRAKMAAHAAFDPMWKDGQMNRREAYSNLAKLMGIDREDCHIGMMNVEQCKRVVEVCKKYSWAL